MSQAAPNDASSNLPSNRAVNAAQAQPEDAPEPAQQPASPAPAVPSQPQPLSKKAQKKLAKAAYISERKKERRAAEKERRKEKKRLLAEKRAAGELDAEEAELQRRKRQRTDKGPRTPFDARVVVDLGFDDMMTENEVKSLTSQLAYTYSANRKAERPFSSLLFTSLNGRTLARMDATNNAAYKRWVGAEWWAEGYERLWEAREQDMNAHGEGLITHDCEGEEATPERERPEETKRAKARARSQAAKDTVIYLTADADDELTELKEGETYIIGGIVDHNRYKNLCLNKSREHEIRSARLPIGTYLSEMRTRKVLTVNQTFEILLKWVETRDWEQALYSVIPKRKFNAEGRRRGGGGSSKGGQSSDEGDAEEWGCASRRCCRFGGRVGAAANMPSFRG
ncbi:guanine-1-methyltransferase-domain-containing protein [Trametes punicea]|nr:guanine-1-methyltransferase-domain-containing protein [Trametes punicea]